MGYDTLLYELNEALNSQKKTNNRGIVKDCCWQQNLRVHNRAGNRPVPLVEINSTDSILHNSQILTTLKKDFFAGANFRQ